MYLVDMYKVNKLIKKYNITLSVAVQLDKETGKLKYYNGFKTLKVPVINTTKQSVEEYTFNKICNAVVKGKKLYPLGYTGKKITTALVSERDLDIACTFALTKGIYYSDYLVFMTEKQDGLGLVQDDKLYIYPIRLINGISMIHLEDKRIYIESKSWVSGIVCELDLDIKKELAIEDNFFANISNYKEKSIKEINNLIDVKLSLLNSLKGVN